VISINRLRNLLKRVAFLPAMAFGVTLVISYHAIQSKSPDDGGMHEQMATDLGVCEAAGSICRLCGRCCSGF
jgi:hypothetical protein